MKIYAPVTKSNTIQLNHHLQETVKNGKKIKTRFKEISVAHIKVKTVLDPLTLKRKER